MHFPEDRLLRLVSPQKLHAIVDEELESGNRNIEGRKHL
jgi:hypothetical protein